LFCNLPEDNSLIDADFIQAWINWTGDSGIVPIPLALAMPFSIRAFGLEAWRVQQSIGSVNESAECDALCTDCPEEELQLESEFSPGGYGTLTNLGGGRWRIVSESRGSDHAIGVRRVGELCWYSSNYVYTLGSASYQDYRLCGANNQTVGNPVNKCISSFFMASNAPFTLEFDASECP
jgi:hypothetical protein